MTHILNFQERGHADNWRRQSFCYAMDEVYDLRKHIENTPKLEDVLNCYSPDDTAADYQDKIRALYGASA